MIPSGSKRERFIGRFKSNKSQKEVVSGPESAQRLQSSVKELQSTLTQQRLVEATVEEKEESDPQADQKAHNLAKSKSTWDLAAESLKKKRPDLYVDLQDLRDKEGSLNSSEWLQKLLAESKESQDDAHAGTRTNTEKILRSILVYKDVALAVSRLDPHGIAPMVLTGVCVVVQAALNGLKHHEDVTAAVEKIAALVAHWTNQEQRSLLHQDIALGDDYARLQRSMVDLYVAILECQVSLTRYCNGSVFRRVAEAAYSLELLRTQLTAIKDKDDNCKTYLSLIDAETAFQKRNAEILQWISPTDPMLIHEGMIARTKIKAKYSDSGEWLLKSPDFVNWDTGIDKNQILWLFGTVGTGKTTLMTKLVEWHLSRSSIFSDSLFAVYYCSDSSGQRSSDSTVILRSLVRQLSWCLASTTISEPVQTIYDRLKRDRPKDGLLSQEDCENVLQAIFKSHTGARVYIDALDECDDPEAVLTVLRAMSMAGNGTVKISICSRTDLRYRAENYFPGARFLEIAGGKTKIDMDNYIRREVQDREPHLRLLGGGNPELEIRLINTLCQRAGGMFRWVELQLSLFLDRKRPFKHPRDVEDSLKSLEEVSIAGEAELNKTYSEIFDRNAPSGRRDRQYARAAYSVVLYAFRVMTLDNLAMMVRWHCAKEEEDDGLDDNTVTPAYLGAICRDFLAKSTSGVVEFAHVSVKEYLQTRKDRDDLEFSSEKCHELIAKICLRYLLRPEQVLVSLEVGRMRSTGMMNEQEEKNYPEDDEEESDHDESYQDESDQDESDEIEMLVSQSYATYHWPMHVKFVDGYMSDDLRMKFLKFMSQNLEPSPAYKRWADDIRSVGPRGLTYLVVDENVRKVLYAASLPTTPIAAICAFGFPSMMGLLNALSSFDWNREQLVSETVTKLLHISSKEGTDLVVKLLLARPNIDVNWADKDGRTALHWAASHGHAAVVTLLLAHPDIDVNRADKDGRTALYRAASHGHAAVVTLLLAHPDIDVNRADKDGWTALHWAVFHGYAAVVTLLLAHPDIDVNRANQNGWTALHWAASKGHAAVVTLLLAHPDIDVNRADHSGRTALDRAASHGYAAVVTLLEG